MEMTLPSSATNNSYCSLSDSGTQATRRFARFSLLGMALALSACATKQGGWDKPGATDQEFQQDRGQCVAQAYAAPSNYQRQAIMIGCMSGKGWQWVER
jgi:hypothetical protein